ncbi:Clusterin-associated protein-1-domain-containing protein [Entophlyctis helioformis]|nr:Clusterin-associated protein-1-domain-containing protein [Entophlyctis helioformis]
MSFREMKTFTEKMRGLGYPKPISMESFRTPNFELTADILLWLVKNYDPSIDVSSDISSEQDRVIFIKTIASFMAPKAHLKLNTRRLYQADGYAVKDLLKIANLLYEANRIQPEHDEDMVSIPPLDISNKVGQLKTCRTLASEITEKGAELYDLLGREIELRDHRLAVISRPFELEAMERAVTEAINKLRDQMTGTRSGIENLHADETNLLAKIEKKKVELDRAEKRLKSLQGVRPAYMDEYEKIEVELSKLYETYMDKFRNLTYLEQQLDEYNREEQDKFEETESSLKRMQNRLREEELRLLRGEKDVEKGGIGGHEARSGRPQRPAGAGSRSRGLNVSRHDSDSDDATEDDEDDDDGGISIGTGVSSGDIQRVGDEDDDDDNDFGGGHRDSHEVDLDDDSHGNTRRGAGDNAQARKRPKGAGENKGKRSAAAGGRGGQAGGAGGMSSMAGGNPNSNGPNAGGIPNGNGPNAGNMSMGGGGGKGASFGFDDDDDDAQVMRRGGAPGKGGKESSNSGMHRRGNNGGIADDDDDEDDDDDDDDAYEDDDEDLEDDGDDDDDDDDALEDSTEDVRGGSVGDVGGAGGPGGAGIEDDNDF